jgi:hypothetical protein
MIKIDIITKDGTTGWISCESPSDMDYVACVIEQEIPVQYLWQDENGQTKTRWGVIEEVLN